MPKLGASRKVQKDGFLARNIITSDEPSSLMLNLPADPEYKRFLENYSCDEEKSMANPETLLGEIEAKTRELIGTAFIFCLLCLLVCLFVFSKRIVVALIGTIFFIYLFFSRFMFDSFDNS